MNNNQIKALQNKFNKYIKSLETTDAEIQWNLQMKIVHTSRVQANIIEICRSLNLSPEQTNLAEASALLHDIGRFEQYLKYGTFKDTDSIDHATLGIKVISEQNILQEVASEEAELILTAINYHNKKDLPLDVTDEELFYCKLIRDADKLDIFDLVVNYYETRDVGNKRSLELSLPDNGKVSDKVYDALYRGKIVNIADVQNLNDFKLLQIGWIFDINFAYAREKILEHNYIERIFQQINCDRDLSKLRGHFNELATTHRFA